MCQDYALQLRKDDYPNSYESFICTVFATKAAVQISKSFYVGARGQSLPLLDPPLPLLGMPLLGGGGGGGGGGI